MILQKIKKNKAFVILFAITLSAIFLSMALGITNIAFNELKFSTDARGSNDAFFAADTGIECGLLNDELGRFPKTGSFGSGNISCNGQNITVSNNGSDRFWTFAVPSAGRSCALVTVDKRGSCGTPLKPDCVISKGYNIGASGTCLPISSDRIEREYKASF